MRFILESRNLKTMDLTKCLRLTDLSTEAFFYLSNPR